MQVKICFKCEVSQPIVNFYRHPMMADGRLGKCKSCTRFDARQNYANNIEKYRQYDRDRYAANPIKRTPKHRGREKDNCRIAVMSAVGNGTLVKKPCEVCGEKKSEAHHADYSKPLEVLWVCRKHHKVIHRMNTEVAI